MPGSTRPGYRRSSAAISIASVAGLRIGAGVMPSPTRSVEVAASAAPTVAIPPPQKQSSHSHSSSKPAASTRRANSGRSSGGCSGRMT
jgi:hypothetical protein